MSLSLALNNALSGLRVNQVSIATSSQNIANANTPGYSRLQTEQSAIYLGGQGSGVQIDNIYRKVDLYLDRAIQRETTNLGSREIVADYYQRVQILLGEPGQDNSIDEYVGNFFTSLQALAESPEATSFKATAVDTAEVLARELSGLALAFEDLRYQADQDMSIAVKEINIQLAHLETLNVAINRAHALNDSTAGLLDQRDVAIEKISKYLNIDVNVQESGAVYVFADNGRIPLVDTDVHQLSYSPVDSVDMLINDSPTRALQVLTMNDRGEIVGKAHTLISSGIKDGVVSNISGGELAGLQKLRDIEIPQVLEQLDMLAANLRDQVNALHNKGSGFPAASELTGTRAVSASDAYDWEGTMTLAILDEQGNPVTSTYDDEPYGYRPLVLDLTTLDGGNGPGSPDLQTIIDEINNHYNAPPVKAQVGNLNNIQLVMNQNSLPNGGAPGTLNFDLDLDNLSGTEAETWITNVRVLDNTGAVMSNTAAGNISDTMPAIAVNPANAYSFAANSDQLTISTSQPHNFKAGDRVYLENPYSVPTVITPGVTDQDVSGYFEVVSVPGTNQFTVRMVDAETTGPGGTVAAPGPFNARPPYEEVAAGDKTRTRDSGVITADVTANTMASYYDIEVTVGVYDNKAGNLNAVSESATITYRIYNNQTDLLNRRLDAMDIPSNTGVLVYPDTEHQYIFARMVDADGNPLPSVNGNYGNQEGYLQLVANDLNGKDVTIALDEGNSKQIGRPNKSPAEPGTNRGFSHYFELNNFFASNIPTGTGDTTEGSALAMAVEERILRDPRLISTGNLEATPQPSDPDAPPRYTLSRFPGDNSMAQALAKLATQTVSFGAAGGLPASSISFANYTGEILGYVSSKTVRAESDFSDNEILLNGLISRSDAISGVNLDEELAQTTLYQQAYTASARAFTITNELFGELLNII
ncbi:MAG: flagellar hook-associated protein FlgK [Rickettsiales bacterium]|nr:flagellar hook-associated protein FlgK [Rickettsiales bacterium]